LETRINYILAFNALMLFCFALFMALANLKMTSDRYLIHDYVYQGKTPSELSISAFFSFIIILNTMLPLDLIVGLEVIYFNIIRFIEAD